jgi:hypothetical protein
MREFFNPYYKNDQLLFLTNFGFGILDFGFKVRLRRFDLLKMIEQSDTTNPQSLRGVGPYDPYGPEAKFQNLKLALKA